MKKSQTVNNNMKRPDMYSKVNEFICCLQQQYISMNKSNFIVISNRLIRPLYDRCNTLNNILYLRINRND